MAKSYIIFAIICVITNFDFSVSQDQCQTLSNPNCESCLNLSGCGFCKDTKTCFKYKVPDLPPCSTSNFQITTCFGKLN